MPAKTVATLHAVPLTATAAFGDRVTASIARLQPISAKARGVGEVSGPALAVTILLHNGTGNAISLSNAIVDLTDAGNAPGNPMSGPPAHPFSGSLAAGADATAVYVFTVPVQHRTNIKIKVSYSALTPDVLFVGGTK
ncbi:MAG: hypothetical protein JWO57_2758 [Pseudonocardiales bacterium]|nr:hypothetical protein [Pseudonocardiales bacterium]